MWTHLTKTRIICFFVTIFVKCANCNNDFFIVNKYEGSQFYCVTNSSSALSWIVEDTASRTDLQQESKFLPRSEQFWNVDCEEIQKNNWTCKESISAEVILDRRWEKMKTYKTDYVEDSDVTYSPLKFTTVANNLKDNFDFPLSIRISQEAHIFLCDGNNVTTSNCYWFILQGFSRTKSAVRKCPEGTLSAVNNVKPKPPCNIIKTEKPLLDSAKFLTNTKWSHFRLSKKSNHLALRYSNGEEIISYTDSEAFTFTVKYIIIHSKKTIGLWKFHEVEYFYTKTPSTTRFQKHIQPISNSICISAFVKMCKHCKIDLEIRNQENFNHILGKQTYSPISQKPSWREIKFIKNKIGTKPVILLVTTTNETENDPYWALDDVRQCHDSGNHQSLRMIYLNETANCQLISDKTEIISSNSNVDISQNFASKLGACEEDAVSTSCVPCTWFLNENCGRLKICQKYNNKITCFCSSGYQAKTTNYHCGSKCDTGKYGHQCNKQCTPYCNFCNHVNGTCYNCNESYTGDRCDIPPNPFFIYPPTISNYTYTDATVHVEDFSLSASIRDKSSYKYVIQYKKTADLNWTTHSQEYPLDILNDAKINGLEPGVKYSVRCVVTNGTIYAQNDINTVEFTTKCDEVTNNDLDVKVSNNSAEVFLVTKPPYRICQITKSQIKAKTADGKDLSYYIIDAHNIQLNDLVPYQNYEVEISIDKSVIKKSFKTTEGVPEKIKDLRINFTPDWKIKLQWTEPTAIYGQFLHYSIKYQIISYNGCAKNDFLNSPWKEKTVTDTSIILSDLTTYTKYSFSVFATNTKFEGLPESATKEIPQSDVIHDDEIPDLLSAISENRSVKLQFSNVSCSRMRGPLQITINAICSNLWCTNDTNVKDEFYYNTTMSHTVKSLRPYADYTLEAKFCRNIGTCSKTTKIKHFRTKPESPYSVASLLVYTKNDSSISVRWAPPHPPSGILKLYKIICSNLNKNMKTETETVINLPCNLWPEYQCFTLENLEENVEYSIDLRARNESPEDFGQSKTVKTTTKTEKSAQPPELEIHWTLENDLEITWKHPVEANGDIKSFKIAVAPSISSRGKDIREILFVTKEKYMSMYQYTIKAENLLTLTAYRISVGAYNGVDGNISFTQDTSPPEIPLFENEPKIQPSNDTLKIETSKILNLNNQNNYTLFVLLQDSNADESHPTELQQFQTNFRKNLSKFRVIYECNRHTNLARFTLGQNDNDHGESNCKTGSNPRLTPGTHYNVTILLVNTVENKTSYKVYSYDLLTLGKPLDAPIRDLSLLALLLLLLIIPIAIIIYIKRHQIGEKINSIRKRPNTDTEAPSDETPLTTTPKHSKVGKKYSKRVAISDLEHYVKESLKNGELERQHALFPRGQTKPWECGALKENKSKNRYTNLIAYDHTRVVLAKIDGKAHSDYINANFIDGYNVPKAFIATQGPKIATVQDFWRMIWQEKVQHIAMLANIYEAGKKKVEQYWPDKNENLSFGDISVQHISNQVFADYEHRTFQVALGTTTRKVHQYHFSSWPDHGVPLYSQSLVPFLENMQKISLSSQSPIIVHCSAGVGRTGTILLCDFCLRMAAEESAVDILRTLQQLRDQRPNMVDNIQQYKLAHLVILEYLVGLKTSIPCNEIDAEVDKLIASGGIKAQIRYLEETAWQDQTMKTVVQKKDAFLVVKEKNRFQSIVPEIQGYIYLTRYPLSDDSSTYINAVKVDGFQNPERFIVTQQPMPNTLGDFWRLIHEKEISVVISLNEINLNNKTCCVFWPSDQTDLKPVDYITLKHTSTLSLEFHDLVTIRMHINDSEEYKAVDIIVFKEWQAKSNCPKKIDEFLSFWEESNASSRQSNPVLITCFDGARASGLYIALSFIIEKMKLEQICDACQAVRAVRHNRSQFVQNEEQFEFLYRAAVAYINGFQFYANFN